MGGAGKSLTGTVIAPLEVEAAVEAPVLAAVAAEMPVDPALPVDGLLLGLVDPLTVGALAGTYGVGAAVKGPLDPLGQLVGVGGFGGDVVGGAGLFVVVGDVWPRRRTNVP